MDLNYQQLCLRLFHFSVLVEQNSVLKSFVGIVFYTSAIRNAFTFHKLPNIYFCEAGSSPGFSSREGQKLERRVKNQKGGGTFLKYSIGCMQQPVGQT